MSQGVPMTRLALPRAVCNLYEEVCGISTVFQWQYDCLTNSGVLQGKNLVFSAPTSAGKTLVAEVVMIKRVIETNKKCIFILPFVSVVREKVYYMKKLFKRLGIRVEGFMGGEQPNGGLSVCDVAICTIEKANSLVNRLIADNSLACLGMVIVDELHMVGDPNRGYLLELLLTKLMFIMRQKNNKELCHTQILGMSATLPNLDVIASWLEASLYSTDFRPVPLQESIKVDNKLIDRDQPENVRLIDALNLKQIVDEDHLISLCYETVSEGHSVLIFCPTKVRCEKLTISIAKGFHFILDDSIDTVDNSKLERRQRFHSVMTAGREQYEHFTKQLKNCPVGLDKLLSDTLYYGVAYHHAGLTFDERDIVEAAFRSGGIRVLIATSTLSSGVNLPARRVIIRTPIFNGSLLDTLSYKQMCGRAGRKGVDNFGESILICKSSEKAKGESLVNSKLKKVESCLDFRSGVTNALKRALLEIIAAGIAKNENDLTLYFESTLLHASSVVSNAESEVGSSQLIFSGLNTLKSQIPDAKDCMLHPVSVCVSYLENFEFIRFSDGTDSCKEQNGEENLVEESCRLLYPTQLGVAALSSSFAPQQSLMVFAELQRARRNFCLDDDLHLVYLVTPFYCHEVSANMEWMNFMTLIENLSQSSKRVAKLVGVEEGFIAKAVRGNVNSSSASDRSKADLHKRFYSALVLLDLMNEVPLNVVSTKYNVSRGQLQTLQQSAATFAGMVTVFCHRLGWKNLAMLLSSFQSRLNFGVHQELVELVRISVLNAERARLVFSAGYHTIVHLANAQPEILEQVLHNRAPFKSRKNGEVVDSVRVDLGTDRKKEGIWVVGSKNALTEKQAADLIIAEAKQLVCDDLKLMGINLLDQKTEERSNESRSSLNSNNRSIRKSRISLLEKSLFSLNRSNASISSSFKKSPRNLRRRKKTRSSCSDKIADKSKNVSDPLFDDDEIDLQPPVKKSSFEIKNEGKIDENSINSKVSVPSEMTNSNCFQSQRRVSLRSTDRSKAAAPVDSSEDLTGLNLYSEQRKPNTNLHPVLDFSFRNDDIGSSSTPFQTKIKSKLESSCESSNCANQSRSGVSLSQLKITNSSSKPTDIGMNLSSCVGKVNNSASLSDSLLIQMTEGELVEVSTGKEGPEIVLSADVLFTNKEPNSLKSNDDMTQVRSQTQISKVSELESSRKAEPNYYDIDSSQDILFDDLDGLPPNQLNTASYCDSSTLSCSEVANDNRVFEPGESSMLFDSDILTQAVFESVGTKSSFCEEPLEDPMTPLKNPTGVQDAQSSTQFEILDVCGSSESFKVFSKKLMAAQFVSVAVYTKSKAEKVSTNGTKTISELEFDPDPYDNFQSISEGFAVQTISFCLYESSPIVYSLNLNLNIGSDVTKRNEQILNLLRGFFHSSANCSRVVCFDGKNVVKSLRCVLKSTTLEVSLFDIGLAWWVLDSTETTLATSGESISGIVAENLPGFDPKALCDESLWRNFQTNLKGVFSTSDDVNVKICSLMAILASMVHPLVQKKLQDVNLLSYFDRIEAKVQLINCTLEQTGFAVCVDTLNCLKNFCTKRLGELKTFAYSFSADFDLNSPEEVGFVLYFDLKLPPNGDPSNLQPNLNFHKVLGLKGGNLKTKRRNGKLKLPPEYNTRNETLIKLRNFHPLPGAIIEFRKVLLALKNLACFSRLLNRENNRIHSVCDSLSATGRMSFREPNIQNIPKVFKLMDLASNTSLRRSTRTRSRSSECNTLKEINCRDIFVASSDDYLLVGADYSQLELRILAHFSEDETLMGFLNGGGDAFKSIASVWKNVQVDLISESDRNEAKQMCYGIIYGMGAKALAEQLNTSVDDAEKFIRSFRLTFPALFHFVNDTVEFCRKHEYVETICERRRYLSEINSRNRGNAKGHAERQAVNSKIQGSASEVLKLALVNIDRRLKCQGFQTGFEVQPSDCNNRICVLVLHLHDEVVYEVRKEFVGDVINILKSEMQSVLDSKLKVKLTVKVKTGRSWGQLAEIP